MTYNDDGIIEKWKNPGGCENEGSEVTMDMDTFLRLTRAHRLIDGLAELAVRLDETEAIQEMWSYYMEAVALSCKNVKSGRNGVLYCELDFPQKLLWAIAKLEETNKTINPDAGPLSLPVFKKYLKNPVRLDGTSFRGD